MAMKKGCAHVRGLYTFPAGSGTQFTDGCNAIWDSGLRVLKIYLTKDYLADYPLQTSWSGVATNLTELASLSQYQAQLSREWEVVVLTTFTFANGTTNWWRVDTSNAKLQAEYTEIYNLVTYLMTTYAGTNRTFVLQNWEGDWAFMDSFNPATPVPSEYVDRYAAFLAVRQKAVSDARRASTAVGVTVLNAIEVNRVLDSEVNYRRIVNDIAPRVRPDLASYSAYDSTIVEAGWGTDTADWIAKTEPLFRKALAKIRSVWPGVPVFIGEFGFPENEATNEHPGNSVYNMTRKILEICEDEGVLYCIYWQVFDNEASVPYSYRGYWFVKPDGTATEAAGAMTIGSP